MQPHPPSANRVSHATLDEFQLPEETATRRLRERYIAARFVQFPEPAHTLNNTHSVMRWARQLLDDDHPRLAAELVQLALEENRSQHALWLCLIELAFLGNDPATFSELCDAFRRRFPTADALPVIDTMGNKLLPHDPRFLHATSPVILPDWSTPESGSRDEVRQRKLHLALIDAMAFHQTR